MFQQMSKTQLVDRYIQMRQNGDVPEILKLLDTDIVFVDVFGDRYQGLKEMKEYYREPGCFPTMTQDPVLNEDGSVSIEFTIEKFWMTFTINAKFTFASEGPLEPPTIATITLNRA